MNQQFKIPKESNYKCGVAKCRRNARYTIIYDYVYDVDGQIVLYATLMHVCEKHKSFVKILKRAGKKFQVIDLLSGKEKVEFI